MRVRGGEGGTAVLRMIMTRSSVGLTLDGNVLLLQLLSLAYPHLLSVIDSLLPNNRPSRVQWLCVSGLAEGYRMGGLQDEGLKPPCPLSPVPAPTLWSWRCWFRQRGKSCLSVWNFIIFNYLDHDGSCSPSLPLPPFHLVTQTQPFLTQPCLSVCYSASFPS